MDTGAVSSQDAQDNFETHAWCKPSQGIFPPFLSFVQRLSWAASAVNVQGLAGALGIL